MRRLMLAVICGLLILASTESVSAGWGHFGWHHLHRVPYVRHYVSHWHRPHYFHHHVHRYHYHRHYVPRYYGYPSFSFSYRYVPRTYYYRPSYYYTYPYCASATPSYYSPYTPYSLSAAERSPSPIGSAVAARPAFDASPVATLAERLIREVASGRRASDSARATQMLGKASAMPTRSRAMSLVEMGDQYFAGEQYQYAYAYYEAAAKADSESAEAHFRQGLAGIATQRYDEAVVAFKHGLEVDPSFLGSTFRLNQIYKDEGARTRHVEALAGTALESPDDPDAFFLIGAFLHFEGTPERAEKYLQRASDLTGDGSESARQFLAAGRRMQPLRLSSDSSSGDRVGPF